MKLIRKLLFPFAILYGLILWVRNGLFNIDLFKVSRFPISTIGIGNLSLGGTGKSIVVDYLLSKYHSMKSIAVLSRGYGRKSKGFLLANSKSSANMIGDEPYQFLKKFPGIKVVVDEDRVSATNKILKTNPQINLVIYDDIMQHRSLKTDHLILTTTYSNPFFNDFPLPYGSLREFSSGNKRSNTIIVTKCPCNLSGDMRRNFEANCNLSSDQKIFYTKIKYSKSILNFSNNKIRINDLIKQEILLVTGIANSDPLVDFLNSEKVLFKHLKYRDHFNFTKKSIIKIKKEANDSIILTTEKDFGKLSPLLKSSRLYFIPISLSFFNKKEEYELNERIKFFIKNY